MYPSLTSIPFFLCSSLTSSFFLISSAYFKQKLPFIKLIKAKKRNQASGGDEVHGRQVTLDLRSSIPRDCTKIIIPERCPRMSKVEWQIWMFSDAVRKTVESDEFVEDSYGVRGTSSI